MITQIAPHVFLGGGEDFAEAGVPGERFDFIISAAKEPWHREVVGYTGRGAPKDHPEYLVAYRPGRCILNFVDAADVKYISKDCITAALSTLHECVTAGLDVLLHCNQGESRAPTIGLLYLLGTAEHSPAFSCCENGYEVIGVFTNQFYPDYNPGDGLRDYVLANWRDYFCGE